MGHFGGNQGMKVVSLWGWWPYKNIPQGSLLLTMWGHGDHLGTEEIWINMSRTLDFLPSRVGRNKHLLIKPSLLSWIGVAARAKTLREHFNVTCLQHPLPLHCVSPGRSLPLLQRKNNGVLSSLGTTLGFWFVVAAWRSHSIYSPQDADTCPSHRVSKTVLANDWPSPYQIISTWLIGSLALDMPLMEALLFLKPAFS